MPERCWNLEYHQVEEGEGVAQDHRSPASAEEVVAGAEQRASWREGSLDQGIVVDLTFSRKNVVCRRASCCLMSQGIVVVDVRGDPSP